MNLENKVFLRYMGEKMFHILKSPQVPKKKILIINKNQKLKNNEIRED